MQTFVSSNDDELYSLAVDATGNYYKYLWRLYDFYLLQAQINGGLWCKDVPLNDKIAVVYGTNPDHMARSLLPEYKKALARMGYIKNVLEDGEWRVYLQIVVCD